MLKAIAFGLATGAGIQAWRAWPAQHPVTGDSLAVVFIVGVICAYLGGRWHGRHGGAVAVAHAEAHATASAVNSVNVAVVMPGGGAGAVPGGFRVPTAGAVPWLDSTSTTPQLTADVLEGLDLSDVVQDTEYDSQLHAD